MHSAQWSYTAVLSTHGAVVARAVSSLPGACIDSQSQTFTTWTEAESCARLLNQDLGVAPVEARLLSIETALTAETLRDECDSLIQVTKSLARKNETVFLGLILAQIELAATFCRMACAPRPEFVKVRLLKKARRIFLATISALERYPFGPPAVKKILSAGRRLQYYLEEFDAG